MVTTFFFKTAHSFAWEWFVSGSQKPSFSKLARQRANSPPKRVEQSLVCGLLCWDTYFCRLTVYCKINFTIGYLWAASGHFLQREKVDYVVKICESHSNGESKYYWIGSGETLLGEDKSNVIIKGKPEDQIRPLPSYSSTQSATYTKTKAFWLDTWEVTKAQQWLSTHNRNPPDLWKERQPSSSLLRWSPRLTR